MTEAIFRAVVFGSRGGIGFATTELLLRRGYCVTTINSDNLNFSDDSSVAKIHKVLGDVQPEVVINCAGVFGKNDADYDTMFNVNVRSNWAILSYYIDNTNNRADVIFVGSTAYDRGRRDYMLYSASKAALHNLYQGAADFFSDTEIKIHIVHPARTRTPMVAPFDEQLDYLEPIEVAEAIVSCVGSDNGSTQILRLDNK